MAIGTLTSNSTLPVDFKDLKATASNAGINISWKTLMEKNSKSFEIQRSTDGTNFSPIKTLAAAGNSSSVINYNYLDAQAQKGDNYYQVVQTDNNGDSKTYGPVVGNFSLSNNSMSVVDNGSGSVQFSIYAESAQKGSLSLYNLMGQKVGTTNVTLTAGYNTVDVATTASNQIVVASLETPGIKLSKKFVKK